MGGKVSLNLPVLRRQLEKRGCQVYPHVGQLFDMGGGGEARQENKFGR